MIKIDLKILYNLVYKYKIKTNIKHKKWNLMSVEKMTMNY